MKLLVASHIRFLLMCVLLLLMAHPTNSLSSTPFFQPSNKYSTAGTFTLDTTPLYGNATLNTTSTLLFNVSYAESRPGLSKSIISLQSMSYDFDSNQLVNISIQICGLSTTTMNLCVHSGSASLLQTLQVRYLLLNGTFTKLLSYTLYYYVTGGGFNPMANGSLISLNYNLPALNSSSGSQVNYLTLSGINASCSSPARNLGLIIAAIRMNATTLTVAINSVSGATINLGGLIMNIILFQSPETGSWPFPCAQFTIDRRYTTTSGVNAEYFDPTGSLMQSYNTFWGLNNFTIANQPSLAWNSTFSVNGSITLGSKNPLIGFQFTSLLIEFKQCPSNMPYYKISTDKCYDLCEIRNYQNQIAKTCSDCSQYSCEYCGANNSCISCDNISDHRVLNISTGTCDPMNGYYDNGSNNSTAQQCAQGCATCFGGNISSCNSCQPEYYLTNTTCNLCMNASIGSCSANCSGLTSCITCGFTNLTKVCLTCNNGDFLLLGLCTTCIDPTLVVCSENCTNHTGCLGCGHNNGTVDCVTCLPDYYLFGSTCLLCLNASILACSANCTDANCLTCGYLNSSIVCLSCISGYFHSGSTCVLCMNTNQTLCSTPCINQTNCDTCAFFNHSIVCTHCQAGFLIQANLCVTCTDSTDTSCQVTCNATLLPTCKTCGMTNGVMTCSSCVSGPLSSGHCSFADPNTPDNPDTSSNFNLSLFSMIFFPLLALLLCCCLIICLIRRRKKEENQVEEEKQGISIRDKSNKSPHQKIQSKRSNRSQKSAANKLQDQSKINPLINQFPSIQSKIMRFEPSVSEEFEQIEYSAVDTNVQPERKDKKVNKKLRRKPVEEILNTEENKLNEISMDMINQPQNMLQKPLE